MKTGKQLRDEGMEKAEKRDYGYVAIARATAIRLAKKHGEVNSDMVHRELSRRYPTLCPASNGSMGAAFRTDALIPVAFYKSRRASSHARWVRVFKYAG